MEFDATNPVNVALTAHDKITVWHRPKLPSCVIAARRDDIFLWVVAERSHSHQVPLKGLIERQMRAYCLERLV